MFSTVVLSDLEYFFRCTYLGNQLQSFMGQFIGIFFFLQSKLCLKKLQGTFWNTWPNLFLESIFNVFSYKFKKSPRNKRIAVLSYAFSLNSVFVLCAKLSGWVSFSQLLSTVYHLSLAVIAGFQLYDRVADVAVWFRFDLVWSLLRNRLHAHFFL